MEPQFIFFNEISEWKRRLANASSVVLTSKFETKKERGSPIGHFTGLLDGKDTRGAIPAIRGVILRVVRYREDLRQERNLEEGKEGNGRLRENLKM